MGSHASIMSKDSKSVLSSGNSSVAVLDQKQLVHLLLPQKIACYHSPLILTTWK
jgi:hypothetical protein